MNRSTNHIIDLHLLQSVTAFIWAEADMLDHAEFDTWLALWAPDSTYIVPIDPEASDFENTLNYAYDDAHMREMRVARLQNGESVSTQPAARTVRNVSRVRVIDNDNGTLTVRAALDLRDFRKDAFHQHTANVTWKLEPSGENWRIQRKIVRLINSRDTLTSMGYIL